MNMTRLGKKAFPCLKYILLALCIVIMLFPVYWMLISSFQPSEYLMSLPPTFHLRDGSMDNYSRIFSSSK